MEYLCLLSGLITSSSHVIDVWSPHLNSPSRCTLAKATDQHHERSPLRGSFRAFGPQGEVLLDGLHLNDKYVMVWERSLPGYVAMNVYGHLLQDQGNELAYSYVLQCS